MFVIPTLPLRTQSITNVYVTKLFSDEQCEKIIASENPDAWQDGAVGGHGGVGKLAIVSSARSVSEQYLPIQGDGFPLNQILFEISRLNALGWSFDLTGFVSDDMPYPMRYAAERGDHYDWHIDVGYNKNASRKVGFSIQLSRSEDYEGGDLEFMKVDLSQSDSDRGARLSPSRHFGRTGSCRSRVACDMSSWGGYTGRPSDSARFRSLGVGRLR